MNEIVMIFTLQGQIIGELVDEVGQTGGTVALKNPAMVVNQGQSVSFFPLMQFVEEETITVTPDKLMFVGTFTPKLPMTNEYRRMFGSGIEVATRMPPAGKLKLV